MVPLLVGRAIHTKYYQMFVFMLIKEEPGLNYFNKSINICSCNTLFFVSSFYQVFNFIRLYAKD